MWYILHFAILFLPDLKELWSSWRKDCIANIFNCCFTFYWNLTLGPNLWNIHLINTYPRLKVLPILFPYLCASQSWASYEHSIYSRNLYHMTRCTHVNQKEKLKSQRSSRLLFLHFSYNLTDEGISSNSRFHPFLG